MWLIDCPLPTQQSSALIAVLGQQGIPSPLHAILAMKHCEVRQVYYLVPPEWISDCYVANVFELVSWETLSVEPKYLDYQSVHTNEKNVLIDWKWLLCISCTYI